MIIKNEMGVIAYFAKHCESAGWELVSIQTRFPDAVVRNLRTGKEYRVEFEFDVSNFHAHGHDASKCDFVICWKCDMCYFEIPVMVLSQENWDAFSPDAPRVVPYEDPFIDIEDDSIPF